jgi:hypothetical protein
LHDYRLYFLDGTHIVEAATLCCEHDAEAMSRARALRRKLELWHRDRLVATIDGIDAIRK